MYRMIEWKSGGHDPGFLREKTFKWGGGGGRETIGIFKIIAYCFCCPPYYVFENFRVAKMFRGWGESGVGRVPSCPQQKSKIELVR